MHDAAAMGGLGISWGALIGGEVTDFLLILNTQRAVDSFMSNKQISLGAEMSVAIGPLGRTGSGNMTAHARGIAPVYSYSHSRGLFAGISLEGAVISARPDGTLRCVPFRSPSPSLREVPPLYMSSSSSSSWGLCVL